MGQSEVHVWTGPAGRWIIRIKKTLIEETLSAVFYGFGDLLITNPSKHVVAYLGWDIPVSLPFLAFRGRLDNFLQLELWLTAVLHPVWLC